MRRKTVYLRTNIISLILIVYRSTEIWRADLYGRRAGAFTACRRPCRQPDVVDGVRRQVVEAVGVDGRRYCDAHVLPEVRVVVVELVAVDDDRRAAAGALSTSASGRLTGGAAAAFLRRIPRELDRVGRYSVALQVGRLLGN